MKRNAGQRGMVVAELLIAIGLSAMIVGTVGSAVFQFTGATERGNQQFRALHDVQNAGYWLTRDGARAESTSLVEGAPPVSSIILNWTDDGQPKSCAYSLFGTDLTRYADGGYPNGTATIVARNISHVEFSMSQGVIIVSITSSPDGRWGVEKEITYRISRRPTNPIP